MLGVRGCIRKNPSLTSARDSTKIEYKSGGQPLPYQLAFGVELVSNPHSKKPGVMLLKKFSSYTVYPCFLKYCKFFILYATHTEFDYHIDSTKLNNIVIKVDLMNWAREREREMYDSIFYPMFQVTLKLVFHESWDY